METRRFLQSVLPSEGWYCVLAIHPETGRRKQKFYETIDHLQDANIAFDENGFNAYFAVGAFTEDGSREADNVARKRAFYLDLDCDAEDPKKFPSRAAAVKELRGFCKTLKLPKPITVNSGGGIHVYWPLDEDVTLEEWQPIADRLKAQCKKHGFRADSAVTADAARILRMPGTHNHKTDPAKPVEVIGQEAVAPISFDRFAELMGDEPIPVPKKFAPVPGSNSVLDALAGNREAYFKDIMVKTGKGKGCAQLAYIYQNQETMSEPMWRAGLSIAKHCVDADKAATRISQRHPEFSPDEMFDKMDRIKGPYLCKTFDEYNPDVCTGCPLWGKIKSPIVLGARTKEATEEDNVVEVTAPAKHLPNAPITTYVIPTFPKPYFRGANGGVYIRSQDEDGDPIDKCVYHNDLYIVRRVHDNGIDQLVFRLHLPKDGVREFTVPQQSITSKDDFRKAISSKGVTVWGKSIEELMVYSLRWIEELQNKEQAEMAHNQFGWTDADATSFVLGNQEIFEDRIDFNPPSASTASLFKYFDPRGTLDGWKENAMFFNKPGMELYQLLVCACFGSVLMHSSPMHGALLHLYSSESGLGKTTATKVGLSIWGNPEKLLLEKGDTKNFKMLRAERYNSLPYVIDEITNMGPRDASDFVYAIPNGKQRGRMEGGANVERERAGEWRFLAISTGNASIVAKITASKAAPKAEAARTLEARVDRYFHKTEDKALTDDFAAAVASHYGHAGVIFLQHYMKNKDHYIEIGKRIKARVDNAAGLTAENRYWSEYITKSLTALVIARQLNLIDYEPEPLFKFCVRLLKENKAVVEDMGMSVGQLIADFFSEHHGNVLWIKGDSDLRGAHKSADALDTLVIPEINPRTKLVARYETDNKTAYILVKPFKAWCIEQQIDYGSCLKELVESMGAERKKMRITKGTHLNLPPTETIQVRFDMERAVDEGTTDEG